MECKEALVLVSGHLDQMNTESEDRRLQEHLAVCPACRAALADYRIIDRSVASLTAEPPEGLTRGVMARVRTPAKPRRFIYGFGTLAAAAAAAVLLAAPRREISPPAPAPAAAVQPAAPMARTVEAEFMPGDEIALVEIVDNADAPAAEAIAALAALRPEAPGDYRTDAATARKIIAACKAYTLFLPDGLDALPDDAPCLVRVSPPEAGE